ncbi:hypothetical protein BSZ31_03000 [Limnobacter sp. SAORIC-690]|nr:hypothetical protein BSZ31_03000 [Limnobacter sp. SAORIC-690]
MGVGVAVVVTTFNACANPMEGSAQSATAIALLNAAATETTPKKTGSIQLYPHAPCMDSN